MAGSLYYNIGVSPTLASSWRDSGDSDYLYDGCHRVFRVQCIALGSSFGNFLVWARVSPKTVGFSWGEWPHYLNAVLYPVTVAAVIIGAASLGGAVDFSSTNSGAAPSSREKARRGTRRDYWGR
jgi:hypothetical protein